MDLETVKKLEATGHEIGSHTLRHCDLTGLSESEVKRNAKESKAQLEKADLGPIVSLAYPYGRYDETIERVIGQHYPLMRSSDTGYNDRYYDSRNIRSMVVQASTTDKEFESWLTYAQEHKLWLVIVYHRVDEHGDYNVASTRLTKQLDMIKNSKLKVMPLGKAAESIRR